MMKRSVIMPMVSAFVVMLLVMCGASFAASEKPIELKFSHFLPIMHTTHAQIYTPFAKEIEERTKGRVKITIYPSEALGKAKDHYDMALQGLCDIAVFLPVYTPGRFPLTTVMDLPLQIPSARVASLVMWELYTKYLKSDYPDIKMLELNTTDPGQVNMRNKPIRSLDDLKGLRMRSPGPQQNAMLKALGASPLAIPIPEVYDALNKGMADGALFGFSALKDFKLFDLLKQATIADLYVSSSAVVMNLKTWNSLPPDIQKIFDEVTGARMSEKAGVAFDRYSQLGMEEAKKAGTTIYSLPPDQRKIWHNRFKPIIDKWIAETDAKGLPGKKVYEETIHLVEKYSK